MTTEVEKLGKELGNISKPIFDLSYQRRNVYRSIIRNLVRNVAKSKEFSEDELDLLLINALSKDGKYADYRKKEFPINGDEIENNGTKLSPNAKAHIEQEVSLLGKRKFKADEKVKIGKLVEDTIISEPNVSGPSIKQAICASMKNNFIASIRPDYLTRFHSNYRQASNSESTDVETVHPIRTNPEFEDEVIDSLVRYDENDYEELPNGKKKYRLLDNVIFNYDILKVAAEEVKLKEKWRNDATVQQHKLSKKWRYSLLRRHKLRRRKITTSRSSFTMDEIKEKLRGNQNNIIDEGITPGQIGNVDETSFQFELNATHVFAPPDAERASSVGGFNEKNNFTAVVAATASGEFLPTMFILEHSEARDDEQSMRVVTNLVANSESGLLNTSGWEKKVWSYTLQNGVKKTCNYLIDNSGNIVTSQVNHYMDETRFLMYSELILFPYVIRPETGKKFGLWMDNYSSHKTPEVILQWSKFSDSQNCKLLPLLLPPNTTSFLQPMDVGVNGPIKKQIRKWNICRIHKDWTKFKVENSDNNAKFKVSAPTKGEAIEKFKEIIKNAQNYNRLSKVFYECGLSPGDHNTFNNFEGQFHGNSVGTLVK